MHDDETWHRGWRPGPEESAWPRGPAGEGVARRRGGPGGPPPGGRGPFGFRGRQMGGWRGGPAGWQPFPGFPFADPRAYRGPRAKRGDVRAAALALIAEEPRNGYQVIQEIESRSGGVWRPSPGSVYPALQQLEDEGLVRVETADGGRTAFHLTDAGRAYVASHADELAAPWDAMGGPATDDMIAMRQLFGQVAMAGMQVVSVGTAAQIESARQVLVQARRSLYGILASDDEHAQPRSSPGQAEESRGETEQAAAARGGTGDDATPEGQQDGPGTDQA
jgi:DNA-binding PadR family transcriptional regulator